MKKITIVLSILLLISLAGCSSSSSRSVAKQTSACKSNEPLLTKKGNISYEYDDNGKLVSEIEEGVSKTTYTYSEDGNKTEELYLVSGEGYEETPSTKTVYDSNDNILGVYISQSYVDSNHLYYDTKYSDEYPLAQEWTMTYENGVLVREEMIFSPYNDQRYIELSYDGNGNVSNATLYVDGSIYQQEIYKYDDHNNVVFFMQSQGSSYLIIDYINRYDDSGLLIEQISLNSFGTKTDIKNYYNGNLLVRQEAVSNVNEGVIYNNNLTVSDSETNIGTTIYEYDDCGTIITSNNEESISDNSYLGTWQFDLDGSINSIDNYLRVIGNYSDADIEEYKSSIKDVSAVFNFENENTLTITRVDKDLSATYSYSDNNGTLTLDSNGSTRDVVIVYVSDDALYLANGPLFGSYNLIEVYKKVS